MYLVSSHLRIVVSKAFTSSTPAVHSVKTLSSSKYVYVTCTIKFEKKTLEMNKSFRCKDITEFSN
jgi:hypothetical protein